MGTTASSAHTALIPGKASSPFPHIHVLAAQCQLPASLLLPWPLLTLMCRESPRPLPSKRLQTGGTPWRLLPGTRAPCKGLESAIPISVIPYLSSKVCPVMLFHFSRTGTGRAAEPDTINLHRESPRYRVSNTTFAPGNSQPGTGAQKALRKSCSPKRFLSSIKDVPHILCLIWGLN